MLLREVLPQHARVSDLPHINPPYPSVVGDGHVAPSQLQQRRGFADDSVVGSARPATLTNAGTSTSSSATIPETMILPLPRVSMGAAMPYGLRTRAAPSCPSRCARRASRLPAHLPGRATSHRNRSLPPCSCGSRRARRRRDQPYHAGDVTRFVNFDLNLDRSIFAITSLATPP